MSQTPLYLIDASIYVFRAYYSIPANFFDPNGNLVNAVYGYTSFLLDFIESKKPALVSVAFDESLTTCYRNDIYPAYKANRELPDPNLKFQFSQCQEITRLLGFHSLCLKHYEADDIIGTLAKLLAKTSPVVIISRDKDLGQLLKPGDVMWDFAADQYTDPAGVFDKFGVSCEQIADFLALAGDTVDNIPGAPGIGAKTAARLLSHFHSLENLLNNLARIPDTKIRGAVRLQATLTEHGDKLRLYRRITGIKCDVPMEVQQDDVHPGRVDESAISKFCQNMGFGNRMQQRILGVVA
ncbi:MAG: 5'-3' exonuclease H3TH domain-containing protein [bacterium]|nr:exodeoxyribonuclease IX [Gammaproteobacteria bacterium]HIL96048.1 exodeoxyribonuclease IX [Pseudomonadales bacterium]